MSKSKEKVAGHPGYVVDGDKIVHQPSGFIAGQKQGDKWVNTDDDGFLMTSSTPKGLIDQNKAATIEFDIANGF